MRVSKPKYYCHLKEGRTKDDDLDIKTLHWLSSEVAKLIVKNFEMHGKSRPRSYGELYCSSIDMSYREVLRVISDVMNREIGT